MLVANTNEPQDIGGEPGELALSDYTDGSVAEFIAQSFVRDRRPTRHSRTVLVPQRFFIRPASDQDEFNVRGKYWHVAAVEQEQECYLCNLPLTLPVYALTTSGGSAVGAPMFRKYAHRACAVKLRNGTRLDWFARRVRERLERKESQG